MAHGQPDYGMYTLAKTIYRLSDMGELAARLLSPVTYDRRGDVIWIDDFEYGITNWILNFTAGGAGNWSNTEYLSKGRSYQLVCPAGVGSAVWITRYSGLPVNSQLGLEFALLPDGNCKQVTVQQYLATVDYVRTATIKYDNDAETITYWDSDGVEQTLATSVKLTFGGTTWHWFKAVVDWENGNYSRFLVDNNSYDMSSIAVRTEAPGGSILHGCQIYIMECDAESTNYVDNVIYTQNEP